MKIALLGYGKMGKTIDRIVEKEGLHQVSMRIDADNQSELNQENLSSVDVAIDFSVPTTAYQNIKTCIESGTAVVSGTPGWLEKLDELKSLSNESMSGFLYASNFSIGVNIFFHLNRKLSEMMQPHPEFRASIEEIHHKEKLDSPSGTAITLAEEILNLSESKAHWVNEHSIDPKALPIISKRMENIAGVHEISWKSEIDEIEIKHTAKSREGFARGAVKAAEWLIDKKGFHTMDEVLGLS